LIRAMHRLAVPPLVPDVTFLFDLEPRIGLARAWAAVEDGQRHQRESRFEAEALAFHEAVRENYLALARAETERFVIIDASAAPEAVVRQLGAALEARLPALSAGTPL